VSTQEPLQIEQVVVYHVRLEMRAPFVTAWGAQRERDLILVEAAASGSDGQLIGWGEAPVLAQPAYNEETVATAWHILNDFLVPLVLRTPIMDPRTVHEHFAVFHGHSMAKAALEGAVWDLWAKRAGLSLRELLGGTSLRVPAGPWSGSRKTPRRSCARWKRSSPAATGASSSKCIPGGTPR